MATIRDVAKMCGVSTATVSNVLNARSTKVSPDTRKKVLRAIRTLQYKPPPLEQSQRAILTYNLALVCGDLAMSPILTNHYVSRIFDGILEAAAFQRWSVTVFVERMWSESGDAVRRSYDGRCDGVIALAPRRDCGLVPDLVERGVPVVSIGTVIELEGVSSVDIDNFEAGLELTNYLIELGHRRIAYFGPYWHIASSLERCTGFRKAMEAAGPGARAGAFISLSSEQLSAHRMNEESIWPGLAPIVGNATDLTRAAFSRVERPTAIICWNEELACEVLRALTDLGLAIPTDVSLVTFDDADPAAGLQHQFTTMRQPFRQIGLRAVDVLISRILNPEIPDQSVRFRAELVVRGSACSPPSATDSLNRRACVQADQSTEVTLP